MAKKTQSKEQAKNLRLVAYVRVSDPKQVRDGVSLDVQKEKLAAYASLFGHCIVAVKVDAGISAKDLHRPALIEALDMLKTGQADGILVYKLDRLTRSVKDLGTLIDDYFTGSNAASLLSLSDQIDTTTAGGRLTLNVLASVSQWEREAISERTTAAMQHLAENGQYTGGKPRTGYVVGSEGQLVPDEREQQAIALARAYAAQDYRPNHIGRLLAKRGFLSRTGQPYQTRQIARMLAS